MRLTSLSDLGRVPSFQPHGFHRWEGASGRWYRHTVLPFTDKLPFWSANYIMVRRNPLTGDCAAIYIGESENIGRRMPCHEYFYPALVLGANEIHLYDLAGSERERLDIETDLRNGHRTRLNKQPSQAMPLRNLGGLGSLYGYRG